MRQQSEKHVREELSQAPMYRAASERGRLQRTATFNKTMSDVLEDAWERIHLDELPDDGDEEDEPLCEREPQFTSDLHDLFLKHFQDLFDMYLFYAKVEVPDSVDAAASELYRMTDYKFRQLLKDSNIVGERDKRTQISTTAASAIFRTVNSRRDHLEKGNAHGSRGGAHVTADKAAHEAIGEATGLGGEGSAQAGSLFGFTFSEFLEGLVFTALELKACAGTARPSGGLTSAYVLSSVGSLLEERVLPNAKTSGVLRLRRALLDSSALAEALAAIQTDFDPVWNKFATLPKRVGAQGKQKVLPDAIGLSLEHFLELCQEAQLIGGQLSRMQVKMIFISSLEISPDSAGARALHSSPRVLLPPTAHLSLLFCRCAPAAPRAIRVRRGAAAAVLRV